MLGTIGFKKLRIFCIIGTEPNERITDQELIIDLKVEIDFSQVAKSDQLSDTVNYVVLADFCRCLAIEKKYFLIETFASDLTEKILDLFPVKSVFVSIKKPSAIINSEGALVELKQERI